MRIELIHPPHPEAIDDRLDVPLGLLYVASMANQEGHDCRVTDLAGIPIDQWEIPEADIYGVSVYVPTMEISGEIARMCKEINPNARVVAGGAHPTGVFNSGMSLEENIPADFDSVVVGEGELAILEIIKDYPDLQPVYKFSLDKDLDNYPNVDYDLVDPFSYSRTIEGQQSITMLTSRGCPYRCTFCGLPAQHRRVKYRSAEEVADEVKDIINKYGIRGFHFQDDLFLVNKKRTHKLLELLKPLNITFRCQGRVGLDTQDDYYRLKEAGCETIAWGIESGSQRILDRMNKACTVEQNYEVIEWSKNAEIMDRSFFILGFPGENLETVAETKAFIEEADPSQYFVSNFQPYPGTEVWIKPEKFGVTHIDKDFSNFLQIDESGYGRYNIETEWMTRDEFFAVEKDFREWMNHRHRKGPLLEYEKKLELRAAAAEAAPPA